MKKLLITFMFLVSVNLFADACVAAYADTPYQLENKINELIKGQKVKHIQMFYSNGKYTAFIILEGDVYVPKKITY